MFKFKTKLGFYGFWSLCMFIIFGFGILSFIILPNLLISLALKVLGFPIILSALVITIYILLGVYLNDKICGRLVSYIWDKSIILGKE